MCSDSHGRVPERFGLVQVLDVDLPVAARVDPEKVLPWPRPEGGVGATLLAICRKVHQDPAVSAINEYLEEPGLRRTEHPVDAPVLADHELLGVLASGPLPEALDRPGLTCIRWT